MKKLSLLLVALLAVAPSVAPPRAAAAAPMLTCLGLKCIAIPVIAGTAYILFRCEPDWYVCWHALENEPGYWFASQASSRALAANGDVRWEGPFKKKDEPEARAKTNNEQPDNPPFPRGPLGTIPAPNTNALLVWLQRSTDGGQHWRGGDSRITAEHAFEIDPADNWQVAVLPASGTNGLTAEALFEIQRCDAVIVNPAGDAPSAFFRLAWPAP